MRCKVAVVIAFASAGCGASSHGATRTTPAATTSARLEQLEEHVSQLPEHDERLYRTWGSGGDDAGAPGMQWLDEARDAIVQLDFSACRDVDARAIDACLCERLCTLVLAPPPERETRLESSDAIDLKVDDSGAIDTCTAPGVTEQCPRVP